MKEKLTEEQSSCIAYILKHGHCLDLCCGNYKYDGTYHHCNCPLSDGSIPCKGKSSHKSSNVYDGQLVKHTCTWMSKNNITQEDLFPYLF